MAYQNPEAGKVLGYIYDNRETPTWQRSVQEGYSDDGTYYRYSTLPGLSVTQYDPAAKKIPLYASPFASTINERPMTKEEQFSVAAQLAGASDMPIRTGDIGEGLMQSRFLSADVRKALGLPNSIDVVRGVDPTKQDWGAQSWKLEYPKTTGFFEDLSSFGKALLTETPILQFIAGGAPVGTDVAANMVAQEAAQVAMEQAVTNALSGTATQAATAAATSAVAQGGISSLLNTVKDLGSTISKEVADTLNGMGIKGISEQAVNKAGMSAAKAAITGGDPLQAALSSVATTGAVENTKDLLSTIDPGIAKTVASVVGGATQAAIGGGDVGLAALTSGATTGISEAVKGSELLKGVDPELKNVINSVAKSVTGAALAGGDLASAVSQGVLSGAMTPTAKPAQPSPAQPAAPVDADELINQMIREQEPIAPIEPAIEPAAEEAQPSFEQFLAGLNASAPTATEDWIDKAGLVEHPQTMDDFINTLLVKDASAATPSEDWIDAGRLISKPLEIEIAGAPPPLDYATPSEEWIDKGGLGFGTEYATPTENFIDQGGLGFGPESSTPTESFIDQGGLGGAPGGMGSNMFGGISGGKGYSAPPSSGPSATDKLVQQLTGQQQQKSNISDLMAMLGIMGASQQQAAPPPIPVVGEIKPYQFSTDLLEGLYPKPRMAQGGSINDLMRIVRG